MTCLDCELHLAQLEPVQNEISGEVQEHLDQCTECRALHQDLRGNRLALESLRSEELPRVAVKIPRRWHVYPWVAAAAALFALALLVPRTPPLKPVVSQVVDQPAQPPPPPMLPQARETAKVDSVQVRPQKLDPLKIKMLTPDPDVVIYWLIED
jgi:hypothetical protein